MAGPEKKGAVMTEAKKKLVAYHEVRSSCACPQAPCCPFGTRVAGAGIGAQHCTSCLVRGYGAIGSNGLL